MEISPSDFEDLKYARMLLEEPGFNSRVIDIIGFPLEKGFSVLPEKWIAGIQQATRSALFAALRFAMFTMAEETVNRSSNRMHKAMSIVSGGVGGMFGWAGLGFELPTSTIIMLRSIADIARSEGEDVRNVRSMLACLEVFALSGKTRTKDIPETRYYATRAVLGKLTSDAAAHICLKGVSRESAPALVRLISAIASRFGVMVTEKAAATAIPVIGAGAGAAINTLFIDHFQRTARGHFIIRRLEKKYGEKTVSEEYRRQ